MKEAGPFQISADQWRRLMNIVYIEGSIRSLQKIRDPRFPYKYDMIVFKYQKRLADLTGNLSPKDLIREMYNVSRY